MTRTRADWVFEYTWREDTFSGPDEKVAIVVEDPALPGCVGYGENRRQALEMLISAREMFLADLQARNVAPPHRLPYPGLVVSMDSFSPVCM